MPRKSKRSTLHSSSVTIRDVAAEAGVSVATVSRVFNDKGPIREETLQRVQDVARRLCYVPHAAARSLSSRSTRTIGVVLPDLHGEFFSEVIRGIDMAARDCGYHVLLSGSHADREEMRAVVQAVRGRVDGLIIMSPDLKPSALVADLPLSIPIVLLNSRVAGLPSITIDNAGGARAMVQHLIGSGHDRIAFLTGPANNADAEQRRRGYLAGMSRHGLAPLEIKGNFTEESGYEAAQQFVRLAPRASAVFAANDAMAIGALAALSEAGIRVPDDLVLVGFDDIPIARFLSPPLTTVKVPIADLGRRGFEAIVQSSGSPRNVRLETTLVVRRSSAHVKEKQ
jgi:LacI family transcriptional regulator